jgi:hypothetical protein
VVEDARKIRTETKENQKYKAAEGVKFTVYDEFGLVKDDNNPEYKEYIRTDTLAGAEVIHASPE